jgi:ATP-dependent Clp protease ATP-binding subunit ClpA
MDRSMATLILKKKLGELQQKLTAKHVELTWSEAAFEQLLNEGFTREYGAREMDRVISQRVKPLLMREILFGSLQKGGKTELLFGGDMDGFQLAKVGA